MATIKFNVSNSDPLTGKKVKYTSLRVNIHSQNDPLDIEFIGEISFHEANDDSAVPPGNSDMQKKVVESYAENFSTNGKIIDTVTKLYLQSLTDGQGDPIPNAMLLSEYIQEKALNSFPGVGGANSMRKGVEGFCKEMIAIRQVNGSLPS